jgi:hypothetical protein
MGCFDLVNYGRGHSPARTRNLRRSSRPRGVLGPGKRRGTVGGITDGHLSCRSWKGRSGSPRNGRVPRNHLPDPHGEVLSPARAAMRHMLKKALVNGSAGTSVNTVDNSATSVISCWLYAMPHLTYSACIQRIKRSWSSSYVEWHVLYIQLVAPEAKL